MRCPNCRTLVLGPASAIAGAGTIVACPRCPATWIARPGDETDLAAGHRPPMIERGPRTIEGALAPAHAAPPPRGFFARRAQTLMAGAVAAILGFGAALALSPGVSAGPDDTTPQTRTMARTMEGYR